MEEQLSGACTVEIAAFDEFTNLLADPNVVDAYEHIIFDTAPTGHVGVDVTCCYATQDKFWVTDPDGNEWEFFYTKGDVETMATQSTC